MVRRRLLKPGGACVIDVKGKEGVARTLQPTTAEVWQDGAIVVKRCQVVDDWTRVRNEVIVMGGSEYGFNAERLIAVGRKAKR
jgi:hypothetical protein